VVRELVTSRIKLEDFRRAEKTPAKPEPPRSRSVPKVIESVE